MRVQVRHGHRDHLASDRGAAKAGEGAPRCGARRDPTPRRLVRDRGDRRGRARRDRHRQERREPDHRRTRRGRAVRSLGHPDDSSVHPNRLDPARRGDRPHPPRRRRDHDLRGSADHARDATHPVGPRPGGEGRLRPVHAEGDLRAAARDLRHDRSAPPKRGPHRPGRDRARARIRARSVGNPACRLRNGLARGFARKAPDRAHRARSLRRGPRQRVSLPRPAPHSRAHAHPHLAVGRDRRHHRRHATRYGSRRPLAGDLQRAREHNRARGRLRLLYARWPRNRCRLVQVLHRAGGGAAPDRARARVRARNPHARPAPRRDRGAAAPSETRGRDAGALVPRRGHRAQVRERPGLPVPRSRVRVSRGARGSPQAEGALLYTRRGVRLR